MPASEQSKRAPGPGHLRPDNPPAIGDAAWLRRPATQAVFAAIAAGGHEARAVGGTVRDTLLGRAVHDVDFATTARPEEVMRLAAARGLSVHPTGLAHGTVTVVADGIAHEVTTLRRDVATYGRHADVAFTDDWRADAERRDFTINALYADAEGRIYDPLGGYRDLVAGRVRFIGAPEKRIAEDYLRILRFFRFTAEFGCGAPDGAGLLAAVRARKGLAQLSAERIGAELLKILMTRRAAEIVPIMQAWGILTATVELVPRPTRLAALIALEEGLAEALAEVEVEPRGAVGEARVAGAASVAGSGGPAGPAGPVSTVAPDAIRRLAALALHVREDAPRLARRLRLSNAQKRRLEAMAEVDPATFAKADEKAARRMLHRLGKEAYVDRLLIAWAHARAAGVAGTRGPSDHDRAKGRARSAAGEVAGAGAAGSTADDTHWQRLLLVAQAWRPQMLPVTGADLLALGVAKGPRIGRLLARLEADWIASDFSLSREALLVRARNFVDSLVGSNVRRGAHDRANRPKGGRS